MLPEIVKTLIQQGANCILCAQTVDNEFLYIPFFSEKSARSFLKICESTHKHKFVTSYPLAELK